MTQEVTIAIEEDPRLQVVPCRDDGQASYAHRTRLPRRLAGIKTMSEESARNWTVTYITVICVEILVLLALWWLQAHYTV